MNMAKGEVKITNEVLHFRPIARLRELSRQLSVEVQLSYAGETLSAANILALTSWELKKGDVVEVIVRGEAPEKALIEISRFIEEGFGEKTC